MNKFLSAAAVLAVAGFVSHAAVAKDDQGSQGKGEEKVCVVSKEGGKARWVAKPAADKQIADGRAVVAPASECPARESE